MNLIFAVICDAHKEVFLSVLWILLVILRAPDTKGPLVLYLNYSLGYASTFHLPVIADTKAQLSDFKLGKKLFQFMRYEILKIVNQKFKKVWIWLLSECKDFLIIFLHIMTRLYL